jgi:hypothetical protein
MISSKVYILTWVNYCCSYSYVLHNLILTRFLVACEQWAKAHPAYSLVETDFRQPFKKWTFALNDYF